VGKIEQANHGTVFLDEIGDMPFSIQAKILRLLQEKSIERLGGRSPIPVDVRVLAATNRDLETALEEGRFREDLYYRLKVVTLTLPPLRDRAGDVTMLAEYFLKKFAKAMNIDFPGLRPEAGGILNNYSWPGNVRELSNTMQKALIFSRGAPISGEEISQAIRGTSAVRQAVPFGGEGEGAGNPIRQWIKSSLSIDGGEKTFGDIIDKFTAILITEALNITGGNRSQAAKLLGLSRPTLLAKIEKYGIKIEAAAREG
jgi:transcriptional regulator with PAS, ATPase and Fis domain